MGRPQVDHQAIARMLLDTDLDQASIARDLGVSRASVYRVNTGQHASDGRRVRPYSLGGGQSIGIEHRERIVHLLLDTDWTQQEIAVECNVARAVVGQINRGSKVPVRPARQGSGGKRKDQGPIVKLLRTTSLTQTEIARRCGVGRSLVSRCNRVVKRPPTGSAAQTGSQ